MTTVCAPFFDEDAIFDDWLAEPAVESWIIDDAQGAPSKADQRPLPDSSAIEAAIENAQSILELGDNWDGDGAVGYSKATLDRATSFLRDLAETARSVSRSALPRPLISPAERGSIDLFWNFGRKTLLINFPLDANVPPTYFGEIETGDTIGGVLGSDDSRRPELASWLILT